MMSYLAMPILEWYQLEQANESMSAKSDIDPDLFAMLVKTTGTLARSKPT